MPYAHGELKCCSCSRALLQGKGRGCHITDCLGARTSGVKAQAKEAIKVSDEQMSCPSSLLNLVSQHLPFKNLSTSPWLFQLGTVCLAVLLAVGVTRIATQIVAADTVW